VAVLRVNGGFAGSLDALARVTDPSTTTPGVFASFFGPEPVSLLGVVLLTSIGTWGLPQMVQKFYAIKSERSINKGTVISTVFAVVVSGGCYFLGSFGRLFDGRFDVAKDGFDAIIPAMLSGFSPLLIGIVIMLVLSASLSTLSALVMTSASTFTLDFIKGNIAKKMSDKSQLRTIRGMIAFFVAVSAVIAIIQYKLHFTFIAQLMGVSWGALAGAFLAPFLYGLYWKRATKAGAWASFAFGTLLMVANILFKSHFPVILQSPINCGAFAMVAGLVIVPVVSLLTKAPDKVFVSSAFECYDRTVTVKMRESLGVETGSED